jgi:hypothetical protein
MNNQKWKTYGVHPIQEDSSYKYYQRMNFQKGGLSHVIENEINKDILMDNRHDMKFYKRIEENCNVQHIPWENTPRVWWNDYRGCITKSTLYPGGKIIKQEAIPYNQPENFVKFLDCYFKNDLR